MPGPFRTRKVGGLILHVSSSCVAAPRVIRGSGDAEGKRWTGLFIEENVENRA
jgi:hypothetical protein